MDRLDELTVFTAILDTSSLAGAARRLRRSAPAVTRALSALEARLGTRLIERTTRRLAPTETGRRFAADARLALASYAAAMRQSDDAPPHGVLRLTAPLIFGRRHVTPVVASFLAAYPLMQAELVLADRNLDLFEEALEVALRIGPLTDTGLTAHRVGEVRRIIVASPAYLASHPAPHAPADLAHHSVVHVVSHPLPPEWRFQQGRRERVVRLAPRLMVNEIEAALVAVRAGHGLARVLSYQVAEELEAGTLVRLLREFERPPLAVSLVTSGTSALPSRVRAFIDHALPKLAALRVVQPDNQPTYPLPSSNLHQRTSLPLP
jgi:DNA-binding transcriptional LysR family regulator